MLVAADVAVVDLQNFDDRDTALSVTESRRLLTVVAASLIWLAIAVLDRK